MAMTGLCGPEIDTKAPSLLPANESNLLLEEQEHGFKRPLLLSRRAQTSRLSTLSLVYPG